MMKHWVEGFEVRSGEMPDIDWEKFWAPAKLYDTWSEAHDALIKKVEDLLDEVKNLKPF